MPQPRPARPAPSSRRPRPERVDTVGAEAFRGMPRVCHDGGMKPRMLVVLAIAAVAASALSGCSRADDGRADVQAAIGMPATTVVVTGADGKGHTLQLQPGESLEPGRLPFGKVKVEAKGLCVLTTTLASGSPTASFLFEPKHCTIG